MGIFTSKRGLRANRIERVGGWPIQITQFSLVKDHEFRAVRFPEIYLVQQGHFLYASDTTESALRERSAILVHPGETHHIRRPENVKLLRVRFMPEFLTPDYSLTVGADAVLSLFLDQSWFRVPRRDRTHLFSVRKSRYPTSNSAF